LRAFSFSFGNFDAHETDLHHDIIWLKALKDDTFHSLRYGAPLRFEVDFFRGGKTMKPLCISEHVDALMIVLEDGIIITSDASTERDGKSYHVDLCWKISPRILRRSANNFDFEGRVWLR
jgi:hypothetical protein